MISLFKWLCSRFIASDSDHFKIALGFFWAALFTFFGKIFSAAKEMAVAYKYGVSPQVDAYLYVFNLVSWPIGIWLSILTVVLIPIAASIQHKSLVEVRRFRVEILGLSFLLGIALLLLSLAGIPFLIGSSWLGLPSQSGEIARSMVFGISLIIPLGIIASLFSVWIIASGSQLNSLFEGLPALIIFIVIMTAQNTTGNILVWGTFSGYVVYVIVLIVFYCNKNSVGFPVFSQSSPYWRLFWRGFGIVIAGQVFMSLVTIVDQFYAAHLDEGSIATLSFANRILGLVLSIGAIAISRATLPVFSKIFNNNSRLNNLERITFRWAEIFFLAGVVVSAIIFIFSENLVSLIFERGNFTQKNTMDVANILQYLSIQIPFYFSGIVFVSLFASQQKYKVIALSGIMNLIVKIIGNMFFVPKFGVNGLALSTGVMYIYALLFLFYVSKTSQSKIL